MRFNERPVLPRLRRQPPRIVRHARRDRRRRRPRRRACHRRGVKQLLYSHAL